MTKSELQKEYWHLGKQLFEVSQEEGFHLSSIPKKWLATARALNDLKRTEEENAEARRKVLKEEQLSTMANDLRSQLENSSGLLVFSYRNGNAMAAVVDVDFNRQFESLGKYSHPDLPESKVWAYLHPFTGMELLNLSQLLENSGKLADRSYRDDVISDYMAWKSKNRHDFQLRLKEWRQSLNQENSINAPINNTAAKDELAEDFSNDARATLLAILELQKVLPELRACLIQEEAICFVRYFDNFMSISVRNNRNKDYWLICAYSLINNIICDIEQVFEFPVKRHADDLELGTGIFAFIADLMRFERPYWRKEPDLSSINSKAELDRIPSELKSLIDTLTGYGFSPCVKEIEFRSVNSNNPFKVKFGDHGLDNLTLTFNGREFDLEEFDSYDGPSSMHNWPSADGSVPDKIINWLIVSANGNPNLVKDSKSKVVASMVRTPEA